MHTFLRHENQAWSLSRSQDVTWPSAFHVFALLWDHTQLFELHFSSFSVHEEDVRTVHNTQLLCHSYNLTACVHQAVRDGMYRLCNVFKRQCISKGERVYYDVLPGGPDDTTKSVSIGCKFSKSALEIMQTTSTARTATKSPADTQTCCSKGEKEILKWIYKHNITISLANRLQGEAFTIFCPGMEKGIEKLIVKSDHINWKLDLNQVQKSSLYICKCNSVFPTVLPIFSRWSNLLWLYV